MFLRTNEWPYDFPHKIYKYLKKPASPFHNYLFPVKWSTKEAVEIKFQVLLLVRALLIVKWRACDLVLKR